MPRAQKTSPFEADSDFPAAFPGQRGDLKSAGVARRKDRWLLNPSKLSLLFVWGQLGKHLPDANLATWPGPPWIRLNNLLQASVEMREWARVSRVTGGMKGCLHVLPVFSCLLMTLLKDSSQPLYPKSAASEFISGYPGVWCVSLPQKQLWSESLIWETDKSKLLQKVPSSYWPSEKKLGSR